MIQSSAETRRARIQTGSSVVPLRVFERAHGDAFYVNMGAYRTDHAAAHFTCHADTIAHKRTRARPLRLIRSALQLGQTLGGHRTLRRLDVSKAMSVGSGYHFGM